MRPVPQQLRRLVETETVLQGFADHGVSEAIYLPDPDGNGIEIYRDIDVKCAIESKEDLKLLIARLQSELRLDVLHEEIINDF